MLNFDPQTTMNPLAIVIKSSMRDYVMDTSHQEKIGVNPLRSFFSPHRRNIHPNVRYATLRYATLTHVYYFFGYFQSPTAETPAWILTLNTSNDVVLRKEVPFGGYKNEISHLSDFW